jgi:hypothetical protein
MAIMTGCIATRTIMFDDGTELTFNYPDLVSTVAYMTDVLIDWRRAMGLTDSGKIPEKEVPRQPGEQHDPGPEEQEVGSVPVGKRLIVDDVELLPHPVGEGISGTAGGESPDFPEQEGTGKDGKPERPPVS